MKVIEENVPELRFPGFDGEWEQKKLGELCEFTQGVQIPMSEQLNRNQEGYIRYLYIRDFFTDDFLYFVKDKYPNKIIQKDEIMMVNTGNTAGKAFKGKRGVLSNNSFKISFSKELLNSDFLFTTLTSDKIQCRIRRFFNSGGQPHLGHKNIAQVKIGASSLPEQLRKKKALLEQYKKGMMQKLFSQELRFKDEQGNDFPDWEEKRLGDLTYKVNKKNKDNIQYPVYSINNQEGFLPQSKQFEGVNSKDRGYDITMYKIIYPNTFAYNPARINVGSIGYSYDLNEVLISSLYVCFRTDNELEDRYLLSYLKTYTFNKDILRYQEGGVRQYLFYENFSHIKIPLPSPEEQRKISTFLSFIDKKINLISTELTHAQSFKKSLLQQMFI